MATAKQKIKLVKDVTPNFRANTARALYYEAIAAYDGKPVQDFVKAVQENPPSVPARGKLAGRPEPVQGWVSFFVRNGYVTVS